MKKYQLSLFILLLINNKSLVTQNPVNVSPASIKNIKKPEHKKFNPKISEIMNTSSTMTLGAVSGYLHSRIATKFIRTGIQIANTPNNIPLAWKGLLGLAVC